MTIDRDDRDDAQADREWMKTEFQRARQRRLVKADVSAVESASKAESSGVLARSTARSSHLFTRLVTGS